MSGAEQFHLSNGIPVILQHYDGPVAANYWWVRTGSADESEKEAGYAHFLEHMLFKDAAAKETGKASTGQMALAIESLGGDINAYTSFDQTVYHVTCAAHHWEKVLDSFGQMARPQRFLKEDFEREREVILEELRKNEDSPGRQLFQKVFSLTFKKHPYGRPVIGYAKILKAAKVAEVEAYYRRNYVPAKMGLVLVGPFESAGGARRKKIVSLLEKHFGSKVLKERESPVRAREVEPELRPSAALAVQNFDVQTPSVCVSFRVPGLLHPDIPAVDLMAGILGMGELSRVYQQLFYKTSIATEASGGLYVPRDPGMLYFQAEVDSMAKIKPATEQVFDVLRQLAEEGPTEEELSRVIVSAESERLYATQTADGMAGRLGFLGYILGDLSYDQRYLEELKQIDGPRIQAAARKYLDYRRLAGAVMVPKAEKYDARELDELARKKLPAPAPTASRSGKAVAHKEPALETMTLPSGIRVTNFPRPRSHVFSVHVAALGGVRLESDWGASNLMALTWTKGTEGPDGAKDAQAIARIVEGRAGAIDGFSGRNSVGIQMTGLSRDWTTLSEIGTEILLGATFPATEVEHSRRISEDSIRGIEDHSSQLCSKLFLETLFEKHPYGRLTVGTIESIQKIDSATLKRYHQNWVRPDRLVVSISGSVPRPKLDAWLGSLDRAASAFAAKHPVNGKSPAAQPEESALKAPRWVEKSLGREQCHVLVGGFGTKVTADDRHALRLMQTLLAGQSGRLFIELREKKSLAYTVAPVSFEGIECGYAGTYIACAPAKREEAVAGIRTVLETLAKKGPTDAEMKRAKEFYLGRRAMDLQGDSSIASYHGLESLYGVKVATEEEITKLIRSFGPKDISRICSRYLIEPYMVHSVVG